MHGSDNTMHDVSYKITVFKNIYHCGRYI